MLTEIAQRTFEALRQGTIRLDIQHRYPLCGSPGASRARKSLDASVRWSFCLDPPSIVDAA